MDYFQRTLYDCTGGRLLTKPPNRFVSHHHTNSKNIKDQTHEIGQELKKRQSRTEHGEHSFVNLFCTSEGELKTPTSLVTMIPNVVVWLFHKRTDPATNITYQIYSASGILTDKAISELIKTERDLNNVRHVDIDIFVKEKLKTIKSEIGITEAHRWARQYYIELEVKNVAGWWNIYWL